MFNKGYNALYIFNNNNKFLFILLFGIYLHNRAWNVTIIMSFVPDFSIAKHQWNSCFDPLAKIPDEDIACVGFIDLRTFLFYHQMV